jgi:hypothetical protein
MRTTEKKVGKLAGAVRGVLAAVSAHNEPYVDFCGNSCQHPVLAVSSVPVQPSDVGKEAILLFEDGDPARPLLVGLVQLPAEHVNSSAGCELTVDRKRLVLTAQEEVTIRCGEASITLTRAGKVLIKGSYLLSKSTGPNRVKGGSVQLN